MEANDGAGTMIIGADGCEKTKTKGELERGKSSQKILVLLLTECHSYSPAFYQQKCRVDETSPETAKYRVIIAVVKILSRLDQTLTR